MKTILTIEVITLYGILNIAALLMLVSGIKDAIKNHKENKKRV